MANRSELTTNNTSVAAVDGNGIPDRMAKFIAEELLPMMIGFWPRSATQINSNLTGNALAYGYSLKGFTANEIRAKVIELANTDLSRDFAPEPQMLRKMLMGEGSGSYERTVSMRSIEMQADAAVYTGCIQADMREKFIENSLLSLESKKIKVLTLLSF
jgi:hypothetical protein